MLNTLVAHIPLPEVANEYVHQLYPAAGSRRGERELKAGKPHGWDANTISHFQQHTQGFVGLEVHTKYCDSSLAGQHLTPLIYLAINISRKGQFKNTVLLQRK